ncbi:CAP domain-containing protein [Nannocystis sp.]|uniref:CAP domain-containing protein n=1 Tax=Nannocystis sp. TaxID=1962667 RepID=UPI0025E7D0EF|nr:CAP domain-containing protein [Nannocystis sp.]
MFARPRLVFATSLLLAGCYVGADLEGVETGGGDPPGTSSSGSMTTPGSSDPTTGGGGGETGGGEASSGAVDPTSGGESTGPGLTTGPDVPPDSTTSTAGDDTTGAAETTGMGGPSDVPDNAHCADVADWSPAWAQLEQDVLVIVNQVRSQGANCGSKGAFGPAGPLTMHPALRCAARKHSVDMAVRNFFDHINPDGETPWDRMGKAGYGSYSAAGENIAAGSPDAAGTMDQWMNSDGHCANIMNPAFEHIGVGYSTGGQYGHLWTQVFGAK